VECDAVTDGRLSSPTSQVFALVVAPDATDDTNTRTVVAAVAVAAVVAVEANRTRDTHAPFAPAVNALKMSVPIVPDPSDFTFTPTGATLLTFGVTPKIGAVFAGIRFS
jgi:hypothetical protein